MSIDVDDEGQGQAGPGLSRRSMIKSAAIAGAAAWTAPVIIDSLSSPAAAFSGCKKKYIKFQPNGKCCTYDPACATRDSGATNLCIGSGCDNSNTTAALSPTFDTSSNSTFYVITLPGTCGFDPTKFASGTQWAVQGNHNDSCTNVSAQASDTGAPSSSSNGYYVTDGQKAYLKKSKGDDYVYIQYCCST